MHVAGIALPPVLSVQGALGSEDTAILLPITAGLATADNQESLSLTIAGVPAGATLSAGTHNADGTWTLTAAQAVGVTLTPPAHFSGAIDLAVTATTMENGTSASLSATLPVNVVAIAHTPVLALPPAAGLENAPIALTVDAALASLDTAGTLAVTIGNVPTGATLSAGVHNADGTYTLTSAQLSGLTLTPPANYAGTLALTVTATTTENGTTASVAATLPVAVAGIAFAPVLTVAPAVGIEDAPIALTVAAALPNIDVNESLSVTIGNLPAGATLSAGVHNADGSYTLTAAQLTGLTLTPPTHFNGALDLTVTATNSENGTTATTAATLPVTVAGIALTPTLTVHSAAGSEDTPIALSINAGLLTPDANESLAVTIAGVPLGATLSAGMYNADGTYTLTAGQLANLTITPPAHWSGSFDLAVTAATGENGTIATTTSQLGVTVSGVATPPVLSTVAASGLQDVAVPLTIAAAGVDLGAPETVTVTIAGVPTGASLSAGVHNADGSWTLAPAQLAGLTLTPPLHWSGTLNLGVTATASENGTSAVTSASLPVTIAGLATAPTLSVQAASTTENASVPLSISAAGIDVGGSETTTVTVSGLPLGATLSAGTHNLDGSYTLTTAQLTGLTLTPPAHFHGALDLTVTATASENGTSASTIAALPVTISGVAATPVLSVQAGTGVENAPVPLNIAATLPYADADETVGITISGLPAGASLSAGLHNADGSYTLTPAQLTGLTLTPPANWNGAFNLAVTATGSESGTTAAASATLPVTVSGIALTPNLSVHAAASVQDTAIPLVITAGMATTDAAETLSVTITGVPGGASLSAGIHNEDGSYTLTAAQLTGLTLTPPAHWSGSLNLDVTATTTENGTTATTSLPLPITVGGVATAPVLAVTAAAGIENVGVPLVISAAGLDLGAPETVDITITGVPTGANLSAGTHNADGSYTLTTAQLTSLTLTPPAHWSGSFNLGVSATATENGTSATTSSTLPVAIAGVATAPILSVSAQAGVENSAIPLTITAAGVDLGTPKTVAVTVSGLPVGATLSAGTHNADGSYTLTSAQLTGLTLTPPANYNGAMALTVTATATDNGTTASTVSTLPITVAGIALPPVLTTLPAAGPQDSAIHLTVGAALLTADANESLGVIITGMPVGATLSAGTHNADGSYTLTAAQLTGLTLTPPAHWSGTLNLGVTATTSENGTTASSSASLPVVVAGVATAPILSVTAAAGTENGTVPLTITAAGVDLGSPETLAVTVTGLPVGATLSAGMHNADGSYTLTSAQLTGLTMTPPTNWSGSLNLGVTATSTDSGTTASTSATLPLSVAGVATAPALAVTAAAGVENVSVPLVITATGLDIGTPETVGVTITGVPSGATLSARHA